MGVAEKSASGRELHEVLEIKSRFNDWIRNMVAYGFVEDMDYTKFLVQCVRGMDFTTISQKRLTAQGNATEFTDL